MPVQTDAGDDLNAFYDRSSLQFFSHTFGGVTVNSAESVDVVTHEQGHAFLDAIRPDFFQVPFIEVGALHEAFGDCMAILNALEDRLIRDAVLKSTPDLSVNQFVEGLAEELGDAIAREYGASNVDVGALRRALNTFSGRDPTSLPPDAPANQLSGEVHSFSRVFSRRLLRRDPQHLQRGQQEGFAGPAEGLTDRGQVACGGPPGRARGAEHLQRSRTTDAPGRRHR